MNFEFNWSSGFRGEDVWNRGRTDGRRTDAGVTGILLAHPWAFGSGELINERNQRFSQLSSKSVPTFKKLLYSWNSETLWKTRNVSMRHGCPRYCQIRINRALALTKGHNSDNNRWILSVIKLDLYFLIKYLCMKYESNTPMYSKDIARKPFFIQRSRAITLIIIGAFYQ